ncbi:MAG: Plug domain-containing protein [Pyrinomonadaceae bacterium]
MAQRNPTSIGEVLEREPGVAKRSFGPGTARPVIRGFDGDRVLVLQNGVRVGSIGSGSGDHGEPIDPLSVERLEVVKGPATLALRQQRHRRRGQRASVRRTTTNIRDCAAHLPRSPERIINKPEQAATSNTVIKTGFSSATEAGSGQAIILRRSAEFRIPLRARQTAWAALVISPTKVLFAPATIITLRATAFRSRDLSNRAERATTKKLI